jgi:hypothetical protein
MAQTRRRRRTKHRGNAAGTIEVRGRTGRPPGPEEKKKQEKQTREQVRQAKLSRPPTWKGSAQRALLAAGFMFIFLLVTDKGNVAAALAFAVFAMLLYIPGGYYMELALFRRRQRKGMAPPK